MTEAKVERPDANFTYKAGNVEKKIFMSFGLLDTIARKIGDIEKLFAVGADLELNQIVMSHLLTLNEKGRPEPTKYDAFESTEGVDFEDLQRLLGWAAGHLTDFFIESLEQTMDNLERQRVKFSKIKERGEDLQSLLVGSKV